MLRCLPLLLALGCVDDARSPGLAPLPDASPAVDFVCRDDRYGFGTPDLPAATFGLGEVTDLVTCEEEGDWFAVEAPLGLAVAAVVVADRPVVVSLVGEGVEERSRSRSTQVQARVPAGGLRVGVRAAAPGPPVRYTLRLGLAPADCEAPTVQVGTRMEGVVCGTEEEQYSTGLIARGAREVQVEVLGGEGLRVATLYPVGSGIVVVGEEIEVRQSVPLRILQPGPDADAPRPVLRLRALGFGGGFRLTWTTPAEDPEVTSRFQATLRPLAREAGSTFEGPLNPEGAVVEVRHVATGLLAGMGVADAMGNLSVPFHGPLGDYTASVRAQVVARSFDVEVGPPGAGPWSEAVATWTVEDGDGTVYVHGAIHPTGPTAAALHVARTAADGLARVTDLLQSAEGISARYDWRPGTRPACGTCFRPQTGHVELSGAVDDADEWDDSVILHELGHVVLAQESRDDSPGGRHDGDRTWPALAWSEGFAHFFAGWVREEPVLRDLRPGGEQIIDLETLEDPRAYGTDDGTQAGDVSELLVAALLWDLYDAANDDPLALDEYDLLWSLTGALFNHQEDRGAPGVDLVDVLDVIESNIPAADLAAVAESRGFPWP